MQDDSGIIRVNSAPNVICRAVFLDFDGVLHAAGQRRSDMLPFEWVNHLAELLLPYPDVALVVHSSWAQRFSLDDLREFLGPLGPRMIDALSALSRSVGIANFLSAHPEVTDWIILDDDPNEFSGALAATLLVCDPDLGISDARIKARLAAWLDSEALREVDTS